MKKSRFSEEQMVKILREADKRPVAQVAKKHAVSERTIYAWRKRFGGLEAVDVKRLRQLEQENAKLKKLVPERDLEIDVMKEVAAKNGERVRSAEADRIRADSAGSRFVARARCSRWPDRQLGTSQPWRSVMRP
jgi:putative transposase